MVLGLKERDRIRVKDGKSWARPELFYGPRNK